jgi:ribosomal protein S1
MSEFVSNIALKNGSEVEVGLTDADRKTRKASLDLKDLEDALKALGLNGTALSEPVRLLKQREPFTWLSVPVTPEFAKFLKKT